MNKEELLAKPGEANYRVPPSTGQFITAERLKEMLPKNVTLAVTEELVGLINNMGEGTNLDQDLLEEDFMSYIHLATNRKGSTTTDLIKAIKFCNLKRNMDNKEAWAIIFPEKYLRLVESNMQIDNHVAMYNKTGLVTAIDKEMMVPVHLMYSNVFHAATKELYNIGVLGKGGKDAYGKEMSVTPMVKVQALKELTTITKPPEEQKISITTSPSDEALTMQQQMNEQLARIVSHQKAQVDAGVDVIEAQVIGIDFDQLGVRDE